MERRELTPEERLLVYKNRRNAIPKVVKSLADSPAEDAELRFNDLTPPYISTVKT